MSKILKYTTLFGLGAFGILQFFRGEYPEVRMENRGDIHNFVDISPEVSGILRAACYDCHSMETNWPWYSKVAPISWTIIRHVREGREDLNFSEWETLPKRTRVKHLKEIAEEVEEGNMPHPKYLKAHPEARLTDEQKRVIINWANTSARKMLVRPVPEEVSEDSPED